MSIDPQTIELDERQQLELASLSERARKPWPVVLNEALAAYRRETELNGLREESVLEAATRLGLVGCVRSGVPDLSTNPKHMEGFGGEDL